MAPHSGAQHSGHCPPRVCLAWAVLPWPGAAPWPPSFPRAGLALDTSAQPARPRHLWARTMRAGRAGPSARRAPCRALPSRLRHVGDGLCGGDQDARLSCWGAGSVTHPAACTRPPDACPHGCVVTCTRSPFPKAEPEPGCGRRGFTCRGSPERGGRGGDGRAPAADGSRRVPCTRSPPGAQEAAHRSRPARPRPGSEGDADAPDAPAPLGSPPCPSAAPQTATPLGPHRPWHERAPSLQGRARGWALGSMPRTGHQGGPAAGDAGPGQRRERPTPRPPSPRIPLSVQFPKANERSGTANSCKPRRRDPRFLKQR